MMRIIKNPKFILPFTFLLSLLMHFHVFKKDLTGYHVWRQTLTQINIEGFYKEDFNILNPRTYDRGKSKGIVRLEFPLMQWIFACFYKLFGNHIVITRIFSFIIGIFSVLGIYFLLKNIFGNKLIGIIGAWTFNFSPVFYYYTMNPLPDNFAMCCSIWGLAYFFEYTEGKNPLKFFIACFFLSLGALAKLPFIVYFIIPTINLLFEKNNFKIVYKQMLILVISIIPVLVWYYHSMTFLNGNPVIAGIFYDTDLTLVDELDIVRHVIISTLPELLINYSSLLFFLSGFYFLYRAKLFQQKRFLLFWAWGLALSLYYLYEMPAIGRVHDYYLFPFLPPIFIIVAYGGYKLVNHSNKFFKKLSFFLLMVLPLTAFLRANSRWGPDKSGFNSDLLIYKSELQNAVPNKALCVVGNDESHNIWYYYLEKKGWAFEKDNLKPELLKEMINNGAEYLFSDSRIVDENPEIKLYLDSMVLQKGSIKIFSLQD